MLALEALHTHPDSDEVIIEHEVLGSLNLAVSGFVNLCNGCNLNAGSRGESGGAGASGSPGGVGQGAGGGGAGLSWGKPGYGGGYGGLGGVPNILSSGSAAGQIYGADATQPFELGSGGGGGSGNGCSETAGGLGGGRIKLAVQGPLYLAGSVAADGGQAQSCSDDGDPGIGGSGSGGSVWLSASVITGDATITASGASGISRNGAHGGAGGGGRIALSGDMSSANLDCDVSGGESSGGFPAAVGGNGTLYINGSDTAGMTNPCGA